MKKSSIEEIIENFITHIENHHPVSVSELPNIDLYMDQVTSFMDTHLEYSKRFPEDKILTKTMINNYAKNRLLPPPEKKKYSKDHMLFLILIYYFKNILSISDIQSLLGPTTDRYFKNEKGHDMAWLYSSIMDHENERSEHVIDEIRHLTELTKNYFPEAPEDEKDYLQLLSMILLLSYDVYQKKQLIETLIDSFLTPPEPDNKKRKH